MNDRNDPPEGEEPTVPFQRPAEDHDAPTVPFQKSEEDAATVPFERKPEPETPKKQPVSHIEKQTEELEAKRVRLAREVEELKRAHKKRSLTITAGIALAVLGSAVAAYLIKGGRIEVDDLPGTEAYDTYLQQSESDREASDWQNLLATAVQGDRDLVARPEFAEIYAYGRPKIIETANVALAGLSDELAAGQLIESPEEISRLLDNLNYISEWGVSNQTHLLEARYRLARSPENDSQNFLAALRSFRRAIEIDSSFAEYLTEPLAAAIDGALAVLIKNGKIGNESDIARELVDFPRDILEKIPRSALLYGGIRINQAFENQDYETCLNEFKSLVDYDPSFKSELEPRVQAVLAAVEKQPADRIAMLSGMLAEIGDRWEIDSIFVLLAENTENHSDRYHYYTKAAGLGNARASVEVQQYKLILGAQEGRQELIDEAVAELEKASRAGNLRSTGILAQVLIYGEVVPKDVKRGRDLAEQAVESGELLPLYALGKAKLEAGESENSEDLLRDAAETIERAIEEGVADLSRHPHFHLYTAWFRLKENEKAFDALNRGAENREPLCLGELGQWWEKGEAPAWEDLKKAREFYSEAAKLGDPVSKKWCAEYEKKTEASGNEADKEWVRQHRNRWSG